MDVGLLLIYVATVIATGVVASKKGRPVVAWVLIAVVGNIFALAAIALLPSLKEAFRPGITKIPDSVFNRETSSGDPSPWGQPIGGVEERAASVHCHRCGALPPAGSSFCPSCGAPLNAPLAHNAPAKGKIAGWSWDDAGPVLGLIAVVIVGLAILASNSGSDDPKPVAQSAPPPATASAPAASPAPTETPSIAATPEPPPQPAPPQPHMATIAPGATEPITPGGKLSKQLGKAWTARVNAAFVAAANRAALSPLCEEVRLTGYSFDRSEPRKHFSVFADCASGSGQERFYMTEAESKLETIPQSVRQIVDRADGFMSCVNIVREKAKFPSTMDYSLWGSNTERSQFGEMGVSLSFTAKNPLGAELPYRAYCIIDDRGVSLQSVKPR